MKGILKLLGLFLAMSVTLSVLGYKDDPEYLDARKFGALTRLELKFRSDDGVCISNVLVNVLMGMNFREKAYYIEGKSDANGELVIQGKTTGNEIEIKAKHDGYYPSTKRLSFSNMGYEYDVKDGKWMPWNMVIELPMRKIRSPVSLVGFKGGVELVATNRWVGFDMKEKDWVWAGHKGRIVDFEAFVTWDGRPVATSQFAQMVVRFVGNGSGYYLSDKHPASSFSGVYTANANTNFNAECVSRTIREQGIARSEGIPPGKMMVVRTRCRTDENGQVVSAYYSTIRALFIEGGYNGRAEVFLNYRFNPNDGDVNLESK